jgi:hypothetical protein
MNQMVVLVESVRPAGGRTVSVYLTEAGFEAIFFKPTGTLTVEDRRARGTALSSALTLHPIGGGAVVVVPRHDHRRLVDRVTR